MKNPVKKLVTTIVITLICVFMTAAAMNKISSVMAEKKQTEINELQANSLKETLQLVENEQHLAKDEFYTKMRTNAEMMAIILKEKVIDGKYAGEDLFEDGMVVKYSDGRVEQPGDEYQPHIDEQQLKQALEGVITLSYKNRWSEDIDTLVTAFEMKDGYYYIDWTSEYEYMNHMLTNTNLESIFSGIEKVYDGILLVADSEGKLIYSNGDFSNYTSFKELGIKEEDSYAEINGQTYKVVCAESGLDSSKAMLLLPMTSGVNASAEWSVVFISVCLIVTITIIIWNYAVQKLVFNNILSEEQEKKYHPKRVRRINVIGAFAGVILMLISVSFVQSMSNLYTAIQQGRSALNILEKEISDRTAISKFQKEDYEDWYVYYGERIAREIARNEELLKKGKFEEISNTLNLAYLIAFDENGREICADNSYVNFELGTKESDQTTDFRRLLKGVDSIVHETSYDEFSGQTKQLIGIRIPFENRNGYGALVLALEPRRNNAKTDYISYRGRMRSLILADDLMMIVDKNSGEILECNDISLEEQNVSAYGIDVNNSTDSLMNYFTINGSKYYGLAKESEDKIYFNFLCESTMAKSSFKLSLIAACLFVAVYTVALYVINQGYGEKEFSENVFVGAPVIHGSKIEIETTDGRKKTTTDPSKRFSFIPEMWKETLPEHKAALTFEIMLGIAILRIVNYVYIKRSASDTLLGFIMQGNWTRGINLFALTSIITLVASILLGMLIIKFIFYMLISIMDTKGETICRLAYNLLQYAAFITALYYAFGYLGFNTSGLLASVGFVTLAVSLGSRDLVADILAGLTIVFEGEYQVGDMVEIDGYRGKVQEIGVRSTKLIGRGDNIKIIGNRDVKNVLNLTRLNSWLPIEITVPASESLDQIEEILDAQLPVIGKQIKEIIRGPYYYGVLSMNKGNMTLSILAECKEEDYHKVQRKLNKELLVLFKQNNIPMM